MSPASLIVAPSIAGEARKARVSPALRSKRLVPMVAEPTLMARLRKAQSGESGSGEAARAISVVTAALVRATATAGVPMADPSKLLPVQYQS